MDSGEAGNRFEPNNVLRGQYRPRGQESRSESVAKTCYRQADALPTELLPPTLSVARHHNLAARLRLESNLGSTALRERITVLRRLSPSSPHFRRNVRPAPRDELPDAVLPWEVQIGVSRGADREADWPWLR